MPNLYQRSFVDDDDDLDLIDPENVVVQPEAPPEEKTWAKRYADLRRLDQKKDTKIKDLESQLQTASKSHLQLPDPNDDKALDEWVGNYPDLARVLTRLAGRQAEQATSTLKAEMAKLEEERKKSRKQSALESLAQAHPDFFTEIRTDEKFHEWLRNKSQAIQDIMYSDNNEDWKSASDVIQMYKNENGIGQDKPNRRNTPNKDVAREVRVASQTRPTASAGEYLFTESQIAKMDGLTYERLSDKIDQAMREGKVLQDMTGGLK